MLERPFYLFPPLQVTASRARSDEAPRLLPEAIGQHVKVLCDFMAEAAIKHSANTQQLALQKHPLLGGFVWPGLETLVKNDLADDVATINAYLTTLGGLEVAFADPNDNLRVRGRLIGCSDFDPANDAWQFQFSGWRGETVTPPGKAADLALPTQHMLNAVIGYRELPHE